MGLKSMKTRPKIYLGRNLFKKDFDPVLKGFKPNKKVKTNF